MLWGRAEGEGKNAQPLSSVRHEAMRFPKLCPSDLAMPGSANQVCRCPERRTTP